MKVRYLFLDNFRGFTNSYVPIMDVNFLVGENSSGKTSVLALLKLLSTNEFMWANKFSTREINLGHFYDIVSAHSDDPTYFSIGVIEDHPAGTQFGSAAMLYTFKEHEGLPRLSQFATVVGSQTIFLRFDGGNAYFKAEHLSGDSTTERLRTTVVPQWVVERSSDGSDYRQLAESKRYPKSPEYPLYVPLMMALEESSKKPPSAPTALHYMREELVWIAPIRTKPARTYDDLSQSEFSSEGSHTPYLIRRVLQSETEAKAFNAFTHRAGKASGLFESIEIRNYGESITAPFEVDAVLDGKPLNLLTVGYGVSQSLPIFVEVLTRPKGSWFAIQQPEVHLHPRAQAALGDVFFEMATADSKRFLIETHSDFTIDRFRMNFRKRTPRKKPASQVLFFERHKKRNEVTSLPIGPDGDLPSNQPNSYREFFLKEQMDLLGM